MLYNLFFNYSNLKQILARMLELGWGRLCPLHFCLLPPCRFSDLNLFKVFFINKQEFFFDQLKKNNKQKICSIFKFYLVIKTKSADEMPRTKLADKKLTNIVFFTHENWPLLEQLKRSSLVPIFQVYVRK